MRLIDKIEQLNESKLLVSLKSYNCNYYLDKLNTGEYSHRQASHGIKLAAELLFLKTFSHPCSEP